MSKEEFKPTNILFCIDIDQTVAGGVVRAHLLHYNQRLKLGMTQEAIDKAGEDYPHTFKVPQIIEYRKNNEDEFQAARAEILSSETVNRELALIAHSDPALNYLLATYSQLLTYYTVRPSEIQKLTTEWLSEKKLPHPENVVMCLDPKDKIKKILADAKNTNTKPILFDDGLEKLVIACEELTNDTEFMSEYGTVMEHLVIVGFGFDNVDQFIKRGDEIGVSIMHVKSWEVLSYLWQEN